MRLHLTYFFCLIFISFSIGQQSSNITLLANWDVDTLPAQNGVQYNDIWGYVDCEGTEYAIMGSASRVHFISLANPSDVSEVASFEGGQNTIWRDMKTFKDRAYAVSDNTNEGLMIFDLSDLPNSVSKTYHSNEYFGRAHNIFIDVENGRLYAVGTNTQSGGVMVFDLNDDPDNPTLLASVNLPANPNTGTGYVHDIFVKENIAYCSHGNLGFFIWDMNDPENPALLASKETGGYNHSSWLSEDGSFAIFAEEVPLGRPLGVMNLENLSNEFIEIDTTFSFPLIENDPTGNTPHNPFIRGNYLICSYYEDGLQVFDITDPMNPSRVAYYDTYPNNTSYTGYEGNWGTYPFLPSGRILASDIEGGLFVLELDQSMTLATIDPPTPPNISNIFPDSSEICEGEELIWEVPDGYDEYTWYKDGIEIGNDEFFITIQEGGVYAAKIRNQHCESFSNEATVIVKAGPDLSGLPQEDIHGCEGEIFEYEVPEGYDNYSWFNNSNLISETNSIVISEPGVFQMEASANGCFAVSEIFEITFSELPDVEITPQGPTEFCEGNFLNLVASTNALDANWSWNLDTMILGDEATLPVTTGGTYEVVITDSNGCSNASEIEITVNPPQIPQIILDGNLLSSSTASFYQWYFNGAIIQGANGQNLAVTEVGEYYVGTVDDNGCFGNSNVINIEVLSIDEMENVLNIAIFPNPVNELLQLNLELEHHDNFNLNIIGLEGKLFFEKNISLENSTQMEINVKDFPQGIYFLKIQNNEGQIIRKFVKI